MRCTLVSNKIIQARERLGLTQQQLAEKLCVTNKAVSKWECGVTLPDISLLVPLCRVLGLTVQELLENGVNVQIGYIETHGRAGTEALLQGLPVIQ